VYCNRALCSTIRVPSIPQVDRARGAPRNLLAVIISVKNKMCKPCKTILISLLSNFFLKVNIWFRYGIWRIKTKIHNSSNCSLSWKIYRFGSSNKKSSRNRTNTSGSYGIKNIWSSGFSWWPSMKVNNVIDQEKMQILVKVSFFNNISLAYLSFFWPMTSVLNYHIFERNINM